MKVNTSSGEIDVEMPEGIASDIVVFSLPSCVQCTATKRMLDKNGISFDSIDMSQPGYEGVLNSLKSAGIMSAPFVLWNGDGWSGFRPDMIKKKLAA